MGGVSAVSGILFPRPVLVSSRALPQNQLVSLRLLAEPNESPVNLREVETLGLTEGMVAAL